MNLKSHSRYQHASGPSISDDCRAVDECVATGLQKVLSSIVGKPGFAPMRHVIEMHAVCGSCGTGQAPT